MLQVRGRNVGDHAILGRDDVTEIRNFARAVRRQLEHGGLMRGRKLAQTDGQTEQVVEVVVLKYGA